MGTVTSERQVRVPVDQISTDIGVLALRVVTGAIFLGHGLQKFGLFPGGGFPTSIDEQTIFLGFFGFEAATWLSWVLTVVEIATGLMLLLGVLMPLAAAGVVGIMLQFVAGAQWPNGLFGGVGEGQLGYEFSIALLAIGVALAYLGAGRWSIDALVGSPIVGLRWGTAAMAFALVVGVVVLEIMGPGLSARHCLVDGGWVC